MKDIETLWDEQINIANDVQVYKANERSKKISRLIDQI